MSTFEVWLIIILVVGVVFSNLAVLKYSSKFKMTQFGQKKPNKSIKKPTEPQAKQNKPADDDDDESSGFF